MNEDAGSLARIPAQSSAEIRQGFGENSLVGMLMDLQTTLDVEQMLALFSRHAQGLVPHSGHSFQRPELNLSIEAGRKGRHSCAYILELEDETLGEWGISRDRRFAESDLERLEILLCHLLYPLRNALRYLEAVSCAHLDPLTEVGNRMALSACLEREVEIARRYGTPFAMVFLDIDHFKAINDDFGHEVGDEVLRSVARCLRETVRSSDGVFRYGGEEFVILVNNTPRSGVIHLAERILKCLSARIYGASNTRLRVTASLGVALLKPEESYQDLLRRADEAMYAAKRAGRNRVHVTD